LAFGALVSHGAGSDFGSLVAGLNGSAGKKVSFTLVRGGQRREVTLELRDYL
jgi:S1-C subfamily serine protease